MLSLRGPQDWRCEFVETGLSSSWSILAGLPCIRSLNAADSDDLMVFGVPGGEPVDVGTLFRRTDETESRFPTPSRGGRGGGCEGAES